MPYWLESDTFADDARWDVLAAGKLDLADSLQAAYCRLKAKTSHLKDNGYLTAATALRYGRRQRLLDLLCKAVLDRPPMLHRKGDVCKCLGDLWVDGFDYRLHEFLKRNPSRTENERNEAQTANRRDPRLRELVKSRDGSCCRYCRSGPLSTKAGRARDRRKVLHLDHVDPDQPAGPDGENYVVACAACSEYKGHRTPDEADMTILPVPTPAEKAAWEQRGQALFDRPPYSPDHAPITDETATNHRRNSEPNTDTNTEPISDRDGDRTAEHDQESLPAVRPDDSEHQTEQGNGDPSNPLGMGRVGPPGAALAAARQPPRSSDGPDVYHRRSRASPPPIPDDQWPPGSTPHRPSPRQESPP